MKTPERMSVMEMLSVRSSIPETCNSAEADWLYGAAIEAEAYRKWIEMLERQEPVAWARKRPDGSLTDEILPNARIEVCRINSGAWAPLYANPSPEDVAALKAENEALQARIDELMAECCPDEMTPEQIVKRRLP